MLKPLLRVLIAAGLTERELLVTCRKYFRQFEKCRLQPLRPLPYHRALEDLISEWITNPEFSEDGKIGILPLSGKKGSFRALARYVASHSSATTLLRELRHHGVVKLHRNNRVQLLLSFYPMRAKNAVDLELFAQLTADFLRTHEVNLLSNPKRGEGLFQRIAHQPKVDARIAPVFNRYARAQGEHLLASIEDWFARHDYPGSKKGARKVRLGLGIYVINDLVR